MVSFSVNYLAVIVASIVSFFFGWVWYGPLFGKIWSTENKMKMESKPQWCKLGYHFLTTLVLVYFFATLFEGGFWNGIILAGVVWAGFIVSQRAASMIWMKQSWKLFWVDISYHILNLALIVIVLGLF